MTWHLPPLPFVSRLAFEVSERAVARLEAALAKEHARSAELLDTILDLKLAGAAAPRRTRGELTLKPRPRSRIQQAIDENALASNNPRLRNHLATWADKELKRRPRDVDEEEWERRVEGRLRTWHVVGESDRDDDDAPDLLDDDDDHSAIGIG
jgi:hypothetical protein